MGPRLRILAASGALVMLGACRPVDRLRAHLELKEGNQSYLAGNYDAAIAHYDRALTYVPGLAQAHLNRAYARVALFRATDDAQTRNQLVDDAVTSFQRYLEAVAKSGHRSSGPDSAHVEQHILTLYLDSGRPGPASDLLRARLQRHPRDIATIEMLASLAADRGDVDEALEWHRKRLEIEADSPEAHYALAALAWQMSFYNRVAEEKRAAVLDEGLQAVLRALELKPDYFEALVYANLLYREKAKIAETPEKRAEYEALYTQYEERARKLREAQKGPT